MKTYKFFLLFVFLIFGCSENSEFEGSMSGPTVSFQDDEHLVEVLNLLLAEEFPDIPLNTDPAEAQLRELRTRVEGLRRKDGRVPMKIWTEGEGMDGEGIAFLNGDFHHFEIGNEDKLLVSVSRSDASAIFELDLDYFFIYDRLDDQLSFGGGEHK